MQEIRLFLKNINQMSSVKKIKLVSDELLPPYASHCPEIILSKLHPCKDEQDTVPNNRVAGSSKWKRKDRPMGAYDLHGTARNPSG